MLHESLMSACMVATDFGPRRRLRERCRVGSCSSFSRSRRRARRARSDGYDDALAREWFNVRL